MQIREDILEKCLTLWQCLGTWLKKKSLHRDTSIPKRRNLATQTSLMLFLVLVQGHFAGRNVNAMGFWGVLTGSCLFVCFTYVAWSGHQRDFRGFGSSKEFQHEMSKILAYHTLIWADTSVLYKYLQIKMVSNKHGEPVKLNPNMTAPHQHSPFPTPSHWLWTDKPSGHSVACSFSR